MRSAVNIRSVAERAGCSIATVSRVVNGTAQASEDVQARVRAAVAELEFRPSEIGRGLKTQRTRTLGVVVPSFTNPVFASAVAGIESVAREHRHSLLLTATEYDSEREGEVVATLRAQNVAGLILTVADPGSCPPLDGLDRAGIPYVLIYNQPERSGRPSITIDNVAGAQELTEALIALGHRRITFLAGRFQTSDRSRLRYQGYEKAMVFANLAPCPAVELDYLANEPGHLSAVSHLLHGSNAPTALIASNDLLAISVMAALRSIGARIPEDVSVAGFDGISIGRMIEPSLTTIGQPSRELGEVAARRLFAMLGGDRSTTVTMLPYTFLRGGSVAPAPPENASNENRRKQT